MPEKRRPHLVDRIKATMGKKSTGTLLTASEIRKLEQDANELANRLKRLRDLNPGIPVPSMSAHLFRVLKDATEQYRSTGFGGIQKKAANF